MLTAGIIYIIIMLWCVYEFLFKTEELDKDDFNKHYPFDIENVKEFAEFCIESGGFKIC